MKKTFLISVVVCIILTSCNAQRNVPIAFPSLASEPISTGTAIATSTLSSTPTRIQPTELPLTPTFTPYPPYRTKKVLFEYYAVGQHSYFDTFYADCCELPNIVLYDDGQMLVADSGETYNQKVLSPAEIKSFLSKLETLGFYSVESNQKHDPTDALYNFEGKYEEVGVTDGLRNCILVDADKSRNLCVHESYIQFLIPRMKDILQYLDQYKPAGMAPYYPDRILLSIEPVDSNSVDLPATAAPWNKRFPSLEFSPPTKYIDGLPASIMYVEGDMAKEIYIFINNLPNSDVFIQDGKKYIVQLQVVLPHETVINDYQ